MKSAINLTEIRNEYSNTPRFATDNTHEAMICKNWYSKTKFAVCVSYFTPDEVLIGSKRNSDNSVSVIVAPLHV